MASGYLRKNGFRIIEKNWRSRRGEVDLVAQKKQVLYFVEVKLRKNSAFGKGEESIHPMKQRKMVSAALDYLQRMKKGPQQDVRFGALVVDGGHLPPRFEWIEFPLDLPLQYY